MGRMYDAQHEHLAGIGRVMDATTNPHHRAVLANYQEHVALEQSGRWPEIFERGLIVDHPVYKTNMMGEITVYDGAEAVGGFYDSILDGVFAEINEKLAVNDWGFGSYSDVVEFVSADTARQRGHAIDDQDATYTLTVPQAMFWLYDENALLIGEHLFVIGTPRLGRADPDDILTKERIIESCLPFIPSVAARA